MNERQKAFEEGRLSTTGGVPPKSFDGGAPDPEVDPETGQHKSYWVLSESERAKGFVRPVRHTYIHVGIPGPKYTLRDLTPEEAERYSGEGYIKFEPYPQDGVSRALGRFWTQEQLDKVGKGCGVVTRMGDVLAETYAREPRFYGSTMCVGCKKHLPVGKDGEFVWDGTDERVGT